MTPHLRLSPEAAVVPPRLRGARTPLAAPSLWRRLVRQVRTFCAQALALLVVSCATPGAVELLEQAVELATGAEGCADEACDEAGGACCTTCVCCVHPNTVPEAPAVPGGPPAVALDRAWLTGGGPASGFRTPPFRPPAA